ncbi:hypothetical protein C8R44DRAFT_726324 [Mycena epipterygia]|nr:hypothetical protein C8R44DRAFT_726324 [Mycena epipterygia]
MVPAHITAIRPFASSSPPPQPLVISLWATDIHNLQAPIPAAHRDVPKFIRANTLKVDIPPAGVSVATTALETPRARLSTPVRVPTSPVSRPATVADDSPPTSPLTDLDSESSEAESESDSTPKIPRPKSASRIPYSELFKDWSSGLLDDIQTYLKKLVKSHLTPAATFKAQKRENLKVFYDLMSAKFPILKHYTNNWATVRLLQAHLKIGRTARKNTRTRAAIDVIDACVRMCVPVVSQWDRAGNIPTYL